MDEFLARTNTTGFIVLKGGKIPCQRYFMSANQNSRLLSFSVAKSFTSTLVGMAIAYGKIEGVNQPVIRYLPELKGGPATKPHQSMISSGCCPVRCSAIISKTPNPTPMLCGALRRRGMGR